jgi:hypothetical protein
MAGFFCGSAMNIAEAGTSSERDRSPIIALPTTPIMAIALPMYLGFAEVVDAPDIYGVPYAVNTKTLTQGE